MIKLSFRPSDFETLKHTLLIRNNSSGTFISKSENIQILEFYDEGVLLKVPKNSCKKGHSLSIFIFNNNEAAQVKRMPESGTIKNSFEVIGKVNEIIASESEDLPEEEKNNVSIVIKLTQFDQAKWSKLSRSYKERQNIINNFRSKDGI